MSDRDFSDQPSSPFLRRRWTGGRIAGRTLRGLLIVLVVVVSWALLLGDSGWVRQAQMKLSQRALRSEIAALQEQELLLTAELDRLLSDPFYREKVAREEWGFKRPGETVYYMQRPD